MDAASSMESLTEFFPSSQPLNTTVNWDSDIGDSTLGMLPSQIPVVLQDKQDSPPVQVTPRSRKTAPPQRTAKARRRSKSLPRRRTRLGTLAENLLQPTQQSPVELLQPPDVLVADTQQSVIAVESRDADNDNTQQHKKKKGRPKKTTLATSKATSASSGAVPKIKPTQHCVPQCNHGRSDISGRHGALWSLYGLATPQLCW